VSAGERGGDGSGERGPPPIRGRALPAVATLSLFAVLAAVSLAAEFGEPAGFPEGNVVRNIGYALLNLDVGEIPAEGLLAAFLIIAVGLDIAIDAAIYLAKREEGGAVVAAVGDAFADGGRPVDGTADPESAPASDRNPDRDPEGGAVDDPGTGPDPAAEGGPDR
jgi:NADH-quinone oxidoreductase subunit J